MSAKPSRRFPKWRILLAFVLVLGAGAWAFARHPWVRAQLDFALAEAMHRELGLDATIGPVRFELPLLLAADDIELRHPQHGLLASAERLEVHPRWFALLRGKLEIRSLIIEGAHVRLRIEDGRIVNLPQRPLQDGQAKGSAAAVRLPLEELVVRRASLLVDASPSFSGTLSRALIHVHASDGRPDRLVFGANAGEFVHGAGREQVEHLALSASLEDGRVRLDSLDVHSSLFNLQAKHASFAWPLSSQASYEGWLELSADLGRLAALPHGLDLPPIAGKLAVRGDVSGKGAQYHARGEVRGDPVLDGFGFGDLELKVDVTHEQVQLLPGSLGRIKNNGGTVGLVGKLGLGPGLPVEVSADVKHLYFHKLMAQLGTTQDCLVNWELRGGFKLSGTIAPVAISGPIWAEHLFFKALTGAWHDPASEEVIGTPPGRVAGRVVIRPDALRFENLHGRLPHSDMLVTVHVGFDEKIGVTARSQNLDLRDATSLMGMPMTGKGSFTLDVGGTYENTTLTGTLDMADFGLDEYRIGHLKTRAILEKEGQAVRFVDGEVHKNGSHYRIQDMFLDFTQAFSIDATGQLDKLALADFYHTFVLENDPDFTPYQGHVKGPVNVRYTLGFPGDAASGTLTVNTELDVLDAQVQGIAFKGGKLEGKWLWRDIAAGTRGAQLEVAELSLRKGRGAVLARGRMDVGGKLQLNVFAEELALAELDPVKRAGLQLTGEIGAAGTVRGTLWVPEAELDVVTVGTQFARRTLGDGHLRVFVTHRDAPWVQRALGQLAPGEPCPRARGALARASWGETTPTGTLPARALLVCGPAFANRLQLDVALGFAAGLPGRGRIDFERLTPAMVWPRRRESDVPISGQLAGFVELSGGELEQPDSLLGQLEISSVRIGQDRATLTSDGPVQVALTGNGAQIRRARFVGNGTELELSGGASLARGLATSVHGKLDLEVLPLFVSKIHRSTGLLDVNVKLTGQPSSPSVFGRATLRHGSLLLADSDQLLEKVEARLSFSEREVLLEQLTAQVAGGQLSAHGSAALSTQGFQRYELFMKARDVSYSPLDNVELSLGADTKLAYAAGGERPIPELTGTVRIQRLRYKRPFSLGLTERLSGLSQAKRVTRASYDPAKDHIAFDLRVIEDAPLRVTNNLLNAELSIEDSERPFRLVGTDQRMGVLGTLEVRRGTLQFRNTEFSVDEGTITFIDEHRVRPRLDLHARTDFRRQADASGAHWWISLHASGEVDNLKLETSSEPALAQEDIALLLTVGLTRAEAERLGTTELTQGAALEALATVTGVDKEVRKALPVIDDFAVTSAYSARTNRTEPQVVVGKRLSDRVRASATTGVTADSNFKTGVEWRLDNQTSLEAGYDNVQTTTSSQFGNVGVDLRWRLEFD